MIMTYDVLLKIIFNIVLAAIVSVVIAAIVTKGFKKDDNASVTNPPINTLPPTSGPTDAPIDTLPPISSGIIMNPGDMSRLSYIVNTVEIEVTIQAVDYTNESGYYWKILGNNEFPKIGATIKPNGTILVISSAKNVSTSSDLPILADVTPNAVNIINYKIEISDNRMDVYYENNNIGFLTNVTRYDIIDGLRLCTNELGMNNLNQSSIKVTVY